jgi:hypothetical protein
MATKKTKKKTKVTPVPFTSLRARNLEKRKKFNK